VNVVRIPAAERVVLALKRQGEEYCPYGKTHPKHPCGVHFYFDGSRGSITSRTLFVNVVRIPRSKIEELALQAQSAGILMLRIKTHP
jgi:hypothetical protein